MKKEGKVLLSEEEKSKLMLLLKRAPRKVNVIRREDYSFFKPDFQLGFSRKLNKLQYDVQRIDIGAKEFTGLKSGEYYSLEELGIPEEVTCPEEQRAIDFLEEHYEELKTEYLNACSKYKHIKPVGKQWRKMWKDSSVLRLKGQIEGFNKVLTRDLRDIQKVKSWISDQCEAVKDAVTKIENAKVPEDLPYNQWEWWKNFPFDLKNVEELKGCLAELEWFKKSEIFS